MASLSNTIDKITVTENDIKALKKAKAQEQERIKNGWRYYKINERIKVLVPFGKDGLPTSKGLAIIKAQKELEGLK